MNRNLIIQQCKKMISTLDTNFFVHHEINDIGIPTISIVMTTNNRVTQTFYTLNTIQISGCTDRIQVIIIDDSPVKMDLKRLSQYRFRIDYIFIVNKFWVNACINYNLGFRFVKGEKIIIQNSEVCHVGDVICYVDKYLQSAQYMVFNVIQLPMIDDNYLLHAGMPTLDFVDRIIVKYNPFDCWYQHHYYKNSGYHFLTAINKNDLDILNGFDYDFCLGPGYDDDELIFRITNVLKLRIVNANPNVMGIHQWHTKIYDSDMKLNEYIFKHKVHTFLKNIH